MSQGNFDKGNYGLGELYLEGEIWPGELWHPTPFLYYTWTWIKSLEHYYTYHVTLCKVQTFRIQYNNHNDKDAFLVCYWNDVRYFQRDWRKSYEHHQIVSHISLPNGFWERIIQHEFNLFINFTLQVSSKEKPYFVNVFG